MDENILLVSAITPLIVPVSDNETMAEFEERWRKVDNLSEDKKDILSSDKTIDAIGRLQQLYDIPIKDVAHISRTVRAIIFGEINNEGSETILMNLLPAYNVQQIREIKNVIDKIVIQEPIVVKHNNLKITLKDALEKYPNLGEQQITSNVLKLKYFPEPVRPSIKNWITDYHDNMGRGKHEVMDRGNFLFHSANGKSLTAGERQKLTLVLRALDENSLVQIDPERQMLVFGMDADLTQDKNVELKLKAGRKDPEEIVTKTPPPDFKSGVAPAQPPVANSAPARPKAAPTYANQDNPFMKNNLKVYRPLVPPMATDSVAPARPGGPVQDFKLVQQAPAALNQTKTPVRSSERPDEPVHLSAGVGKLSVPPYKRENPYEEKDQPPVRKTELHLGGQTQSATSQPVLEQLIKNNPGVGSENYFAHFSPQKNAAEKQPDPEQKKIKGEVVYAAPQQFPAEMEKSEPISKPPAPIAPPPPPPPAAPPTHSQAAHVPYRITPMEDKYEDDEIALNDSGAKISGNVVDLKN